MKEIILSFFAVIGITLLVLNGMDFIFYKKYKPNVTLKISLETTEESELIRIFELVSTVRKAPCGKALIQKIEIELPMIEAKKQELLLYYLKLFELENSVLIWKNANDMDLKK